MGLRPDIPRSLTVRDARPAKPELARPLAISSLPLAPPADKEAPSIPRSTPLALAQLGPRSGPVSFWEKLTRATSRSASVIPLSSFESRLF